MQRIIRGMSKSKSKFDNDRIPPSYKKTDSWQNRINAQALQSRDARHPAKVTKYPFMERGEATIPSQPPCHISKVWKIAASKKTWVPSAPPHLTAPKNVLIFLPLKSRWPSRGRRSLRGALHNSLSYLWVIFPFCSFFLLTGFSFTSSSTWFFWFCYSGLPSFLIFITSLSFK